MVISASLQACGVVFPFAMLTSICRSIVTICSGLYLLIGMTRFSSKWILSHSTWYKFCRSRHIHVLDIPSGIESTLTIPASSFPPSLVLSSEDSPNHPSLKFIYAVDDDRLLLWFLNPVSGPDWGVNDTSQAIYTISTKNLTFLSEGEMDPTTIEKYGVALLNYQTNNLIVLGNANAQGLVTTRTTIDLASGQRSVSTLMQPGDPVETRSPVHSCDYHGVDTYRVDGYLKCRKMWLTQLLSN